MKSYLRDVTELTFIVNSDTTVTDSSGKVTEHHQSTHDYTYRSGKLEKKGEWGDDGKSKVTVWEVYPDGGIISFPYMYISYHGVTDITQKDNLLVVSGHTDRCSPWKKASLLERIMRYPDIMGASLRFRYWCGTQLLRVSPETMAPVDGIFTAYQLAPDLIGTDVPGYEFRITFQRISIPGHREPFTIPLEVTLTLKDKHKTRVVRNSYAPAPGNN